MDYSKLSDDTLKALKEGKQLDYSKLSNDEVQELSSAQKAPTPVSKTESALRGAAQGATFGFADELTGALEALATDKPYAQARDESRANYKAAEEENPMTYMGGSLAGGLAVPLPFGGAKTLGQLALRGGAYGAAAGLGAGEADLTKGEVGKAGLETLKGAGIGALGSTALAGLGKAGEALADSNVGKSFKEGLAGNNLVGKTARQKIGDELVDFAGKTGQDIQGELSQAAKNKMSLLKTADESGQKLDITDLLNKTYPEEAANLPKSFTSEGDAARRALNEPIDRAKGSEVKDTLSSLMDEVYGPNPTASDAAKVEMSPTDIDSFRRALGRLGFEKDLKDDQVVALAKRMSGKIGDKANTEVEGLGDVNKKISNLIDAQDTFNIGNGLDELGNQTKLTPLLQRLESDSVSSDVARSKFGQGIESLKNASPELGNRVEQKATELANRYDLARDINKNVSFTGNPVEMAKRLSARGSNVAGFATNKVAGSMPGEMASAAFKAAPEYINSMATRLEAKGSKFAPILKNIANESEPKRKALMFGLMQQPAFREDIKSSDEGGDE